MDLALRVVETAGARPAVGAAINGRIAVLPPHPVDLAGDEIERGVPIHLDERLGTPPVPVVGPAL